MKPDELVSLINSELKSLEQIYLDIMNFPKLGTSDEINNYDKAAIALLISQFYNGIENLLKQILKFNNIRIANSEDYHVKIIETFRNDKNLPQIFTDSNINGFTILRRFRHYVFHGYSFKLEWDKLLLAIETLPDIFNDFVQKVNSYKAKILN